VIKAAAEAGHCITRADRVQVIHSFSLHKGTTLGDTIYFGSPQSQTLLRVYDKRLELLAKKHPDSDAYWIRWELEFKQDRAQLCAKFLVNLNEGDWKESVVGLLRSYVDFRDTTRDAEDEEQARASRLPWYEALTNGFTAARLTKTQAEPDEERAKQWIVRSVAPMLAAICALPKGQEWMEGTIAEGADRWRDYHRTFVKNGIRKRKGPSA
jgi:phage replication initiation protein